MKKLLSFGFAITIACVDLFGQFMAPTYIHRNAEKYTASFIGEWGNDTACIETFTIIGNHLFGRAIHLYPEPHLRQFEFWYNEGGDIRSLDIQFYDLNNTSLPLESTTGLPYRIMMNSEKETVDFRIIDQEGEKQFVHLAKRMDFFGGWIPIYGQWQWLSNLAMENKLADNLKFLNYVIGIYELEVKKEDYNKVIFESSISAPITFMLDAHQKIEKIDAMGSPWNHLIHRLDPIDIEIYTKRFANKKAGAPSPRSAFSSTIADAEIQMDYGRPYKRGREIFGSVVPYNTIWRTGAGSPTRLITIKTWISMALSFRRAIITSSLFLEKRPGPLFSTQKKKPGAVHTDQNTTLQKLRWNQSH